MNASSTCPVGLLRNSLVLKMDQPPPPPPLPSPFGVPQFQSRPSTIHHYPTPTQGPSHIRQEQNLYAMRTLLCQMQFRFEEIIKYNETLKSSALDSFSRRLDIEQAANVSNMIIRNTQEKNNALAQQVISLTKDVELWKGRANSTNAKVEDLKRSLSYSEQYIYMLQTQNRDYEEKLRTANGKADNLEQQVQQFQIAAQGAGEEKRELMSHLQSLSASCQQQTTRISELEAQLGNEKALAEQLEVEKTNRAEDKVIIEALKIELEKYKKSGAEKVLNIANRGLKQNDLNADGASCSNADNSANAAAPQNTPKRKVSVENEEAKKIPKEARISFNGGGNQQELVYDAESPCGFRVETPNDLRISDARAPDNLPLAVSHDSAPQDYEKEEIGKYFMRHQSSFLDHYLATAFSYNMVVLDSDDETWVIDC
ncbi:unnamed protein product [Orchesella dallaii]|uniref:Uncharacterized protein n=1 Tax=Orchesella dallaii TaxID=48710 RepID=A0ABP1Q051_9HEXA